MALDEAAGDDVVLAEVLLTLAAITDDIEVRMSYAVRAVELLDGVPDPDPVVLSGALAQAAGARFRAGTGLDHRMFERAIAIEQEHPARRISDRADASYAALLKYADDLDGAEARLLALLDEARAIGDLSSIAYALSHLVHCALWRGDLTQGRAYADEHIQVAAEGDLVWQGSQAQYNLGLAMACSGQLDDAAAVMNTLLADHATSDWIRHRADGTLGLVALSRNESAPPSPISTSGTRPSRACISVSRATAAHTWTIFARSSLPAGSRTPRPWPRSSQRRPGGLGVGQPTRSHSPASRWWSRPPGGRRRHTRRCPRPSTGTPAHPAFRPRPHPPDRGPDPPSGESQVRGA